MTTFRTKIIVNPNSGHKDAQQSERDIDRYLDKTRFDYDIERSKYRGHTAELAKEAVDNNYDLVIAVGGDGTVNEIGSVLTDTENSYGYFTKRIREWCCPLPADSSKIQEGD
jgi:diacylglycerol kinase family enzyme